MVRRPAFPSPLAGFELVIDSVPEFAALTPGFNPSCLRHSPDGLTVGSFECAWESNVRPY
jgi:hypothetical protein